MVPFAWPALFAKSSKVNNSFITATYSKYNNFNALHQYLFIYFSKMHINACSSTCQYLYIFYPTHLSLIEHGSSHGNTLAGIYLVTLTLDDIVSELRPFSICSFVLLNKLTSSFKSSNISRSSGRGINFGAFW